MRWRRVITGGCGLCLAWMLLDASGAGAQEVRRDRPSPFALDLSPPADTGKPRPFRPSPLPAPQGCEAAFDCRLQLRGAIQHNGAVELNGTAFRW